MGSRPDRRRFSGRLRLEWSGSRTWSLLEPFGFHSAALGWISVPAGFTTDLTSLPGLARLAYRVDGGQLPAAVVHDYLYVRASAEAYPGLTRRAADRVFLEAMRELGVPRARRWLFYAGVRLGGWRAWREL